MPTVNRGKSDGEIPSSARNVARCGSSHRVKLLFLQLKLTNVFYSFFLQKFKRRHNFERHQATCGEALQSALEAVTWLGRYCCCLCKDYRSKEVDADRVTLFRWDCLVHVELKSGKNNICVCLRQVPHWWFVEEQMVGRPEGNFRLRNSHTRKWPLHTRRTHYAIVLAVLCSFWSGLHR